MEVFLMWSSWLDQSKNNRIIIKNVQGRNWKQKEEWKKMRCWTEKREKFHFLRKHTIDITNYYLICPNFDYYGGRKIKVWVFFNLKSRFSIHFYPKTPIKYLWNCDKPIYCLKKPKKSSQKLKSTQNQKQPKFKSVFSRT
jgi:hypothetical protein